MKILTVGQTPPPDHGQAEVIERIITGKYQHLKIFHVRMAFSRNVEEIGRFRLTKLLHLIKVIALIMYMRFRHGIKILHYPPAGPHRIPMYRDIVILLCTRWLFQRTIFFFHAGGISELYPHLPACVKLLFRWAYFHPDLTIILSAQNPPDGEFCKTKKNLIISHGINDFYPVYQNKRKKEKNTIPVLLYVGILNESKGVLILLDACRILKANALEFRFQLMGGFISKEFEATVLAFIANNYLQDCVEILGVHTGDEKWNIYAAADIFCFPVYEKETFGLVILEAMQFELPVVSTRWRGIPSIVRDGHSGFIVPVKDSNALAEKIAVLLRDPELRILMGTRGRQIYLEKFTIDRFWSDLENAFISIA